jgi:hypothetical protein
MAAIRRKEWHEPHIGHHAGISLKSHIGGNRNFFDSVGASGSRVLADLQLFRFYDSSGSQSCYISSAAFVISGIASATFDDSRKIRRVMQERPKQ